VPIFVAKLEAVPFNQLYLFYQLPNTASYVEIDSNVVDGWGIPTQRFHYKLSDYEWKQARHMERTYIRINEQMGATGRCC